MVINNKETEKKVKRIFFIVSLLIVLAATAFILKEKYLPAIISGCGFAVWYLIFRGFDFQYIEYSDEDSKIIIRYYPIIKFGSKEYSSIEFHQQQLNDVKFNSTFFGLITDLILVVNTKRGVAEYPSVSLTAMPGRKRKMMEDSLHGIMGK